MKTKKWTNGEWTIKAYNTGNPENFLNTRVEVFHGQGKFETCPLIATTEKEIYDHQKKDERFFIIMPNHVMEKAREMLRNIK